MMQRRAPLRALPDVTIANPPRGPAIESDVDLWTRAAAGDQTLYTVAGNLARNEHRSATRLLRAVRRLPDTAVEADHADDVAHRVDGDARMARILAAVRTLPRSEREAVELCLLGEVPIADAAELLGLAEVSVRSRLSRARAHLRTKLEGLS